MKYLLSLLLAVWVAGCGLHKETVKNRSHTVERGKWVQEVPADSVIYRPKVVYKDTTITVERRRVLLRTTYEKSGKMEITCVSKPQKITGEYERESYDRRKEIIKDRSGFQWKDKYFLWIIGAVALLIFVNNKTK